MSERPTLEGDLAEFRKRGIVVATQKARLGPWHRVGAARQGDAPHRPGWIPAGARIPLNAIWADDSHNTALAMVDDCGCWARVLDEDTLDFAWAKAEEARPEYTGVMLSGVQKNQRSIDGEDRPRYSARWWKDGRILIAQDRNDPAEALRALAEVMPRFAFDRPRE
jgi:hypothetical protein